MPYKDLFTNGEKYGMDPDTLHVSIADSTMCTLPDNLDQDEITPEQALLVKRGVLGLIQTVIELANTGGLPNAKANRAAALQQAFDTVAKETVINLKPKTTGLVNIHGSIKSGVKSLIKVLQGTKVDLPTVAYIAHLNRQATASGAAKVVLEGSAVASVGMYVLSPDQASPVVVVADVAVVDINTIMWCDGFVE